MACGGVVLRRQIGKARVGIAEHTAHPFAFGMGCRVHAGVDQGQRDRAGVGFVN